MRRKVIKQAGQAYTVTLPIQWVRDFGIDAKKEVDITVRGNQLIFTSEQSTLGEVLTLDATNLSKRSLYQTIFALYARGVDEIRIKSSKQIFSIVRDCVPQLISFAVFEEKEYCVLKEIGMSSADQLENMYKQVWQLIMQYYESVIADVCGPLSVGVEEINKRDQEINKFCLYLQRLISKQAYSNPQQGQIFSQYAFLLEMMSDDINRIWRFSAEQKKHAKPLAKLLTLSLTCLQDAFHISYNLNHNRIDILRRRRDDIRELALSFTQPHYMRVAHYALNVAERSSDMMHLALMWRVRNKN